MEEIFRRVSIRKYQEKDVEPEKIEQLMRAAMAAPSATNQQPWEFYVVRDKELIRRLSEVHQYAHCAAGAPVVIVPVYRENCKTPIFAQIDMSLAVENMWLMTESLGLGGVWLAIAPREERMKLVGEMLSLPEGLTAFALFAVGYPAEQPKPKEKFDPARIHYIG